MPVWMFRLGEEPRDDLTATTMAAERIEMVIELSARLPQLSESLPRSCVRHEMPVRVISSP